MKFVMFENAFGYIIAVPVNRVKLVREQGYTDPDGVSRKGTCICVAGKTESEIVLSDDFATVVSRLNLNASDAREVW